MLYGARCCLDAMFVKHLYCSLFFSPGMVFGTVCIEGSLLINFHVLSSLLKLKIMVHQMRVLLIMLICFPTPIVCHLNICLQNEGKEPSEEPEQPGAIISNHISYLDILYHMSSSFPSFVAKVGW